MPKRKADFSAYMPPPSDVEIEPETHAITCAAPGCHNNGENRAPKSRTQLHEYQWLCDDHIKQFNKAWNYFDGMGEEEIVNFQKDAALGHRPTWRISGSSAEAEASLHAAFWNFREGDMPPRSSDAPFARPIPETQREALATLDLSHPATQETIKKSYKALVKKHHPDLNRDDSTAEERFKRITAAYQLLIEQYNDDI